MVDVVLLFDDTRWRSRRQVIECFLVGFMDAKTVWVLRMSPSSIESIVGHRYAYVGKQEVTACVHFDLHLELGITRS